MRQKIPLPIAVLKSTWAVMHKTATLVTYSVIPPLGFLAIGRKLSGEEIDVTQYAIATTKIATELATVYASTELAQIALGRELNNWQWKAVFGFEGSVVFNVAYFYLYKDYDLISSSKQGAAHGFARAFKELSINFIDTANEAESWKEYIYNNIAGWLATYSAPFARSISLTALGCGDIIKPANNTIGADSFSKKDFLDPLALSIGSTVGLNLKSHVKGMMGNAIVIGTNAILLGTYLNNSYATKLEHVESLLQQTKASILNTTLPTDNDNVLVNVTQFQLDET